MQNNTGLSHIISQSTPAYGNSDRVSIRNDARPVLVIEDMALEHINEDIRSVVVAPLFVEAGNGGAVTLFADIENRT